MGAARAAARLAGIAAALACALAAPPARAQRVDNPFVGAAWYLSPEYAKNVAASAAQVSDPTLKAKVAKVATYPTAFWLDRTAAIAGYNGRMGLAAHLDAALAQQQQAGKPMVVIAVVYNLPGRDCAALSSNGELGPTDLDKYKTQYIDAIAAIEGNPKYAPLRIINIVELDSLPNLITNAGNGHAVMCDTMKANKNYEAGIRYAVGKLHAAGQNIYNYLDVGHHGWLGWDNNFGPTAQLLADTVGPATGGFDTVQGFISNTSNYSALVEPFVTVSEQTRPSKWLDWNRYVDEKSFVIAFRQKLVSLGFKSSVGMLIDTSRNGWGGPNRPTKASTASDVDTMVNESRIDRRNHAGNWCNQAGAGLGERPQVVDADGIHAYVWVKPPGESDGSDHVTSDGKGIDGMCKADFRGEGWRNGGNLSGALPNSPLSGAWFHSQLVELVQNAYPPVPADGTDPGPGPGPGPGPATDFQLVVSPAALTLNQGESGSTTIIVGLTGGSTGSVALSASGLPAGVTQSFAPATSAGGQSTLTLTASATAATAAANVTVTGTMGSVTHSANLNLTVNTASSPSFTLSANPASVTIPRGGSATVDIRVQPSGGFNGSVGLVAEQVPAGINVRPSNPYPMSNSSTTVTIEATASAAVGSGTFNLIGTSTTGSISKWTPVSVTVTDGSGSSSGGSSSGGSSSGGSSSGGSSSGGTSSGGSSSGGTSSGGTSSSGSSSSGGKTVTTTTVGCGGPTGCSTAGGADAGWTLLALSSGLRAIRRRRR
jgi:cellulose 1,4-beta-cellobiosidase